MIFSRFLAKSVCQSHPPPFKFCAGLLLTEEKRLHGSPRLGVSVREVGVHPDSEISCAFADRKIFGIRREDRSPVSRAMYRGQNASNLQRDSNASHCAVQQWDDMSNITIAFLLEFGVIRLCVHGAYPHAWRRMRCTLRARVETRCTLDKLLSKSTAHFQRFLEFLGTHYRSSSIFFDWHPAGP